MKVKDANRCGLRMIDEFYYPMVLRIFLELFNNTPFDKYPTPLYGAIVLGDGYKWEAIVTRTSEKTFQMEIRKKPLFGGGVIP